MGTKWWMSNMQKQVLKIILENNNTMTIFVHLNTVMNVFVPFFCFLGRRSLSKFYHGKSKSFTTLLGAASCSTKDFIKPENAYTRKRKNLLAYHITWNTSNSTSKRPAIATSMNKINTTSYCNGEPANIASMVGSSGLKKCCLSMRSYSMMNLQGTSNSRSAIRPCNNEKM